MLMFNLLLPCLNNCGGTTTQIAGFKTCENPGVKVQYGVPIMAFELCSNSFTDVLDPTELESKLTSLDVIKLPAGTITFSDPTETIVTVDGFGNQEPVDTKRTITFVSVYTDSAVADSRFYRDLVNNASQKRVIIMDRNQKIYVPVEWADIIDAGSPATIADTPLGFPFSFTKTPHIIAGEGNLKAWTFEIQIQEPGVLQEVLIPGWFDLLS